MHTAYSQLSETTDSLKAMSFSSIYGTVTTETQRELGSKEEDLSQQRPTGVNRYRRAVQLGGSTLTLAGSLTSSRGGTRIVKP
jgi:hypothetical protein